MNAPYLYHFCASWFDEFEREHRRDGTMTCTLVLSTNDLFSEVRASIATLIGAPVHDQMILRSLTLLNPH